MEQTPNECWLREGYCWICAAPADSAEHIAKASDLRANWERTPFLLTPRGEKPIKVQGPKSDIVKYRPSLCGYCNSTRFQFADVAWDEFKVAMQDVARIKAAGGSVYLPKLFSRSRWREVMVGVHLYFAKALGCFLAECYERPLAHGLREALLVPLPCPTLKLYFHALDIGDERLVHRSSLNVRKPFDAAFFFYSFNRLCVAAAVAPVVRHRVGALRPWHPDRQGKIAYLHPMKQERWNEGDGVNRLDELSGWVDSDEA